MKQFEILIGFLLGAAIWAVVMVLQSDASLLHQICETNQYTEHENCTPHHPLYVALYYIGYAINPVTLGAAATVAIAVFTYTLYGATKGLVQAAEIQSADMKQSIVASQIAANAADLSARAAIALQLPIIRINPDSLMHGDGRIGDDEYEEISVPGVILSNLGTTKAFPIEILHGWCVGDELPSEPLYRFVDTFPPNFILEADPKTTPRKRLTMAMPLEPGQWAEILKGNYLWFYCEFRYRDFMGENRSHAFCWRWTNTGMGLSWRVESALNYNRKT